MCATCAWSDMHVCNMSVHVHNFTCRADIEPNQLISVAPSDLQTHVAALHAENGYGAENEYEVS